MRGEVTNPKTHCFTHLFIQTITLLVTHITSLGTLSVTTFSKADPTPILRIAAPCVFLPFVNVSSINFLVCLNSLLEYKLHEGKRDVFILQR